MSKRSRRKFFVGQRVKVQQLHTTRTAYIGQLGTVVEFLAPGVHHTRNSSYRVKLDSGVVINIHTTNLIPANPAVAAYVPPVYPTVAQAPAPVISPLPPGVFKLVFRDSVYPGCFNTFPDALKAAKFAALAADGETIRIVELVANVKTKVAYDVELVG